MAGKKDDAIEILNGLKSRGEDRYYPAIVNAALGEKDRAFEYLEKYYRERSDNIPYLRIDPTLEILHPDPRFKALLQKLKASKESFKSQRPKLPSIFESFRFEKPKAGASRQAPAPGLATRPRRILLKGLSASRCLMAKT
ncbi:MAG: TPR end-of-group domain-containing protein [Candidatus Aminicenantales bacterium]